MTLLPIVGRELRVAARRRGTFWTRTAVALVAIGLGVFLYLANLEAPPQVIGRRIFFGLIALAMFFCLFAGRRSTADCLSQEKRQGTLGLLFLTDLRGFDIVLGKLAATSLNGFYCLVAVFPVLAVPLLLGGITNGEFWRVVLVLTDTFVFSLAVGIFVSALSRDARRAAGANLLLLLLIIGIPGACAAGVAYLVPRQSFHQELLLSCPLYALYQSDDGVYRLSGTLFWWSVGLIHGLTWILLSAASWAVRHSWQDRPVAARGWSWRRLTNWLRFGPVAKRAAYRRRLLDSNAFYWLAARSRFKPLHVWGVLIFVGGWWIWAQIQFGTLWLDENTSGTNLTTAVMLNVALKLWVALEAGRQLAEERQAGSFELLLSTPLRVHDIIYGQRLALKRQFLAPIILSTLTVIVFMLSAVRHSPLHPKAVALAWLGAILLFATDVVALYWTAMYCALTTRSPNQAAIASISRIVFAPAIVFAAIVVLGNLYAYFSGQPEPNTSFYISWWLGLGVATDLIYGLGARHRLLSRFRMLACSDKTPRAPASPSLGIGS
ncbi:MAG TPA: ABC transporter permease subunit [Verrucomicrobiae bacterium]|nr:ABC transporter permease subunit [Verrucomicrobiae bacterium]